MKFFSIPEVQTSNFNDYINLPKSEREHKILFVAFYKIPYALPFGGDFGINLLDNDGNEINREKGWEEFYSFVKKEYPIQYFMRETIPTYFYSLRGKLGYWKWKDFYYNNIRTIFHPFNNNARKVIGRSWKDFQSSIVEINFAIVNDLVTQEYKEKTDYLVVLPYMNVGFGAKFPKKVDWNYFSEFLDREHQSGKIAIGANGWNFLVKNAKKYKIQLHKPENFSKYIHRK